MQEQKIKKKIYDALNGVTDVEKLKIILQFILGIKGG